MANAMSKIGFIGAGRVGTALALGLAQAGYSVAAVASHTYASAQALATIVVGAQGLAPLHCKAEREPSEVVAHCDIVFLTVPDDAIEAVAGALTWRKGQAVVHCRGALSA